MFNLSFLFKEKNIRSHLTELKALLLLTYYRQDALTEVNTSIQRHLSTGIHKNESNNNKQIFQSPLAVGHQRIFFAPLRLGENLFPFAWINSKIMCFTLALSQVRVLELYLPLANITFSMRDSNCNLASSVEVKIGTDLALKIANKATVLQTGIMGYFTVLQSNPTSNLLEKLCFRF